jgi:antitoxin (DNA-binding transcriptional repressor) of toxin-antitoxin stability system
MIGEHGIMSDKFVNVHAAKTRLSQLMSRAERGERIIIARNWKPVAQLGPAPRSVRAALSNVDPLLNLDDSAIGGAATITIAHSKEHGAHFLAS